MKKLEMKNYSKILIEKLQKQWHYHQAKLIKMNIVQVKLLKLSLLIHLLGKKEKK